MAEQLGTNNSLSNFILLLYHLNMHAQFLAKELLFSMDSYFIIGS